VLLRCLFVPSMARCTFGILPHPQRSLGLPPAGRKRERCDSATRPDAGLYRYVATRRPSGAERLIFRKNKTPEDRGFVEDWSGKRDSNSRPRPWQGRALPTELFPREPTILRIGWSVSTIAALSSSRSRMRFDAPTASFPLQG